MTTYYLGDLTTGAIVEELPLSSCQWSKAISSAGGWSATLSTAHPLVTRDLLTEGRSIVWVDLDGSLEFGGLLWNLRLSPESGMLTLGGEGLWSYFHRRRIRSTLTYTTADLFTVVSGLVNAAQGVANGDIGMGVSYPTGATAGVSRTITYSAYERKLYGEEVEALAEADDGFEFLPIYGWSGSTPTMSLECHHRRRGRHLGTSWELGRHYSVDGDYERDGSGLANQVDGSGSGSGAGQLYATATGALNNRKRLDAVTEHKDTTATGQLQAQTNQDLARLSVPVERFKLKSLNPDPLPSDWNVGDEVYVVGELAPGWMLDDSYRIVAYQATVDEQGALSLGVEIQAGVPLGKPLPTVRQYQAATRVELRRRVSSLERR